MNRFSAHIYSLPSHPDTDRPRLGVVAGEQATLLVDAGNSPAHARLFLDELSQLPIAPARFLALTHWHWDHVFSSTTINQTMKYWRTKLPERSSGRSPTSRLNRSEP